MTRLTPRQRVLLQALAKEGPSPASALAGYIRNTPETVAAALRRLKKRGLATHERPDLSPSTWTTKWDLTDAGREAVPS